MPFFILMFALKAARVPRRIAVSVLPAGLLASGSVYSPLPSRAAIRHSGFFMAFVPGYSGGSAMDSHHLPY
jgi:hypothetical protein